MNLCVKKLKDEEAGVEEWAEDSDKEALTSGSSYDRTITVVKGNSSLGVYLFALEIFCLFFFYLSFFLSFTGMQMKLGNWKVCLALTLNERCEGKGIEKIFLYCLS